MKKQPCRRCFSLVELLVVVAVIAILAAIIYPAIRGSIRKSHETYCASNLRQLGIAINAYKPDYRNQMPPWLSTLYNHYLQSTEVYRCKDGLKFNEGKGYSYPATWVALRDEKFQDAYDKQGTYNKGLYGNDPNTDVEKITYFYEFNESENNPALGDPKRQGWNLGAPLTLTSPYSWNDIKQVQFTQGTNTEVTPNIRFKFQPNLFPMVRCSFHYQPNLDAPYFNLALDGGFFKSKSQWEKGVWKP